VCFGQNCRWYSWFSSSISTPPLASIASFIAGRTRGDPVVHLFDGGGMFQRIVLLRSHWPISPAGISTVPSCHRDSGWHPGSCGERNARSTLRVAKTHASFVVCRGIHRSFRHVVNEGSSSAVDRHGVEQSSMSLDIFNAFGGCSRPWIIFHGIGHGAVAQIAVPALFCWHGSTASQRMLPCALPFRDRTEEIVRTIGNVRIYLRRPSGSFHCS